MVEQITAGNLPLGIFHDLEPELCTRQLLEGDYVIMVSDGIVEGLAQSMCEDAVFEAVSAMKLEHPKKMANALLNFVIRQTGGRIRDDMSVIVIGLWEKL